ncbi:hypothetical protein [Hansschlegelia zhihuaiae]|jgi:hypothetical protein|uniref:Uncharacterized protein n=1 Tax=Hansschlegelia zhihuaiae TaxID=405005 RepID=A0A4Q0MLF7_9HYPH|nr:hypothetical protein [Hansschlegelia zhihuaiae]RXF73896.1 hypothetical protein EK403_07940 [Hansschlegelia zhihuaiae]
MPAPFKYSDAHREYIRATLAKVRIEQHLKWFLKELEHQANLYLSMVDWSNIQPDRKHLEERHQQDLTAMRRVQALIAVQCPDMADSRIIPKPLPEEEGDEEEIFLNEIRAVIGRFENDKISGQQMLNVLAIRALDLFIQDEEEFGSIDARLRDGREKKHRTGFISWIATHWALMQDKKIENCTISAADGSPMLEFVKACLEPVTAITGENAGNETIKNIVNAYRQERRSVEGDLQ